MKHLAIFLFSILALHFFSEAQNDISDTISIEKRTLGADFNYKGKDLSLIKLEDVCQPYPDAIEEILLAKRNNNPSIILTLVGAGLIGYTGFKWLMGDDPQWYFAAGGAVLIGATIPLYIGTRNHSINAARIYNYEIKHLRKTKK
jgi:hypothetical protein